MAKTETKMETKKDDSNIMAAIAYLLGIITGIVIYLVEKENKYVRFHAVQSMFLCIAMILIYMALGITIVGVILYPLLFLASLVLWLFMMYKAYSREKYKLPYIGDLAERYA
jgi:uncharacterized membrane protein